MSPAAAWWRFGLLWALVGFGIFAVFVWLIFARQTTSADRVYLFEGLRGPRDYQDALRHRVVLVYPTVSGRVLSHEALVAWPWRAFQSKVAR
jgi:hypothetical protein